MSRFAMLLAVTSMLFSSIVGATTSAENARIDTKQRERVHIDASSKSRHVLGVSGWDVVTSKKSGSVWYFVEGRPINAEMSPTFAMIEVSNANGLVLSMQRGQKLVSYNQSISRSGDAKQQLLIHGGASYAFSDVLKLDAKSKDNARSQASREISPMIAVFMAMEEAKELRNSIPEDLLGTAIKTLYSAQASLDDFVAPSEIQTKMPGYCIIPAQTMGAVAAAINYNLGPTGSLTCASACSGFAACVSFGVMMVNPSCWAMAAGCAGCTSSGLQSVLDECSREFMYFIRK